MKKGIIFALTASLISGISIFYNKLVIVKGIDPLIFNIVKNGGVGIILSILLLTFPQKKTLFSLSLKQWKKLFLIALIGGSIPFLLFFTGLQTVSAPSANLIQKTLFIYVAAMAIPFLGERLNIWQILGYIIVVWSNIFIGGFSGFTGSLGELLILTATILWSIEIIISRLALKELDSNTVAWGRMFIGTIFLILYAITQNKLGLMLKLHFNQILPILGSIVLLTVYVTSWYKALKHAPATAVTAILVLATPITNILSVIFITHNFPQVQITNLLSTTFGITLIGIFFLKGTKKKWI